MGQMDILTYGLMDNSHSYHRRGGIKGYVGWVMNLLQLQLCLLHLKSCCDQALIVPTHTFQASQRLYFLFKVQLCNFYGREASKLVLLNSGKQNNVYIQSYFIDHQRGGFRLCITTFNASQLLVINLLYTVCVQVAIKNMHVLF